MSKKLVLNVENLDWDRLQSNLGGLVDAIDLLCGDKESCPKDQVRSLVEIFLLLQSFVTQASLQGLIKE